MLKKDELLSAKVRKFSRTIHKWYKSNKRAMPWRVAGEPIFRLVVTEVLLQRTRAETVAKHYETFFDQFPDWTAIASADTRTLENALKPFGLWKQRSQRLQDLSRQVVSLGGQLPRSRRELQALPCMGQYVVNATMLFMGVENAPLLDVGMARVLERYFGPRKLADIRYDPYLQKVANEVVSGADPIEVNWAILDLAALVCCAKEPACQSCPLKQECRYARHHR